MLWIACSGLDAAMYDTMKPLIGEVVMIKTAAMPGDNFVHGVLSSLSPLALDRGVYSLNNLKERFNKVEKVARRVAWVGEDGGSLLKYGLSYLQSVLMVGCRQGHLFNRRWQPISPQYPRVTS